MAGRPRHPPHSSPEKRPQADWRVMPSAVADARPGHRPPAQLEDPRPQAVLDLGAGGGDAGDVGQHLVVGEGAPLGQAGRGDGPAPAYSARISSHSPTHSSQMWTPGPAMSRVTCVLSFPQNEQEAKTPAGGSVSIVMASPL